MKKITMLPLSLAIISYLSPITVKAEEMISREELNRIVAQAVEKALAERDARGDSVKTVKHQPDKDSKEKVAPTSKPIIVAKSKQTASNPPTAVLTDDPEYSPEDLTPNNKNSLSLPYGFKFSAYARYGLNYQTGDQKYIGVDGSYNGTSGIGRLGNEAFGGEFQFGKTFLAENGAVWDANIMFDHWSDELNLKKAYVGVTNLFASQPNSYLWAGRDFHQRPAQEINDYMWMNHDGQGAGIKELSVAGMKLDIGAVGQVESCDPHIKPGDNPSRITCTGGAGTGEKGNYALTSKLHGISVGDLDVALYANYGFDSKAIEQSERTRAWQGAVVLSRTTEQSQHQLITRYSDNADNSVYSKTSGLQSTYISFDGLYTFNTHASIKYLLAYQDYKDTHSPANSRKNYAAIVRPMYYWNDIHSTWLEAGWQRVNYHSDGANEGWKLTLSQNISFALGQDIRPMLRFYVTGGEVDNRHTARVSGTTDTTLDSLNLGAMWEIWF